MTPEKQGCEFETDLTAYLQGELPPERVAEVESHIEGCGACSTSLRGYRSVFEIAAQVEDIVPSIRFKRRIAGLLDRRATRAEGGLLLRLRMAGAYLAHRVRTSPRFRLAAVSVAVHTVLLLALFFVIMPGIADKGPAEIRIVDDGRSEQHSIGESDFPEDPIVHDVSPPPLHPTITEPTLFPRGDREPGSIALEGILPPDRRSALPPLRPIFATDLAETVKIARLATQTGDGERAHAAIRSALSWLAARQRPDGTWAADDDRSAMYRTGITASVLLAFLSEGQSMGHGEKRWFSLVERAVNRLLADQVGEGELEGLYGPAVGRYNYNHALATMALSEVWVLDRFRKPELCARIRASLRRALGFTARSQTAGGGWRYTLEDTRSGLADTSVTLFQAMALLAADGAGIRIDGHEKMIDRLTVWLRSVTGEDGIVGYQAMGDRNREPRTLTAGALFLEESLGFAAPLRARQAAIVRHELSNPAGSTARNGLLRFYSALAFRLRGEKVLPGFAPGILNGQREDGSWDSSLDRHAIHGGDAFLTALNVLTLTTSYRWAI